MTLRAITTDADLWSALIGLYEYDTGCTWGIHDEVLRAKCKEMIEAKSEDEFRFFMSRMVRDAFLSEESLSKGFGIEDATRFVEWLGERMGFDI